MDNLSLKAIKQNSAIEINLPSSKSESNRLLIMQALANNLFKINGLSLAEDTKLLQRALQSSEQHLNVGMAGTAYRFLCAFFVIQEGKRVRLSGADRMYERPIGILVDALRKLGAQINYLEKEGYPPLEIVGKKLSGGELKVDASVSSQFISALLLIAPYLSTSLKVELSELVSKPYVDLTVSLMKRLNADVDFNGNIISVLPSIYYSEGEIEVEKDWSSAAFFYQMLALTNIPKITFVGLSENSLQGDRRLASVFESFGVKTVFTATGVELIKGSEVQQSLSLDLTDCPDLIPSVAVTAAILCDFAEIKGVQTLRIKESDRVSALKNELDKIGVKVKELGKDRIQIIPKKEIDINLKPAFSTYNDHRMAMCLAPLAVIFNEIEIENPKVVSKSFPHFWEELEKCGVVKITS